MTWTDDEGLMDSLSRAVGQERAVPDHRRHAAYGAFAWRSVDQELMALTHDSLVAAGAAVRGPGDVRTLAFEGGGLSLELEMDGDDITGQVLRATGTCVVTLERADGDSRTARTDASGFFVLGGVSGPARFAVDVDGDVLRTDWTVL